MSLLEKRLNPGIPDWLQEWGNKLQEETIQAHVSSELIAYSNLYHNFSKASQDGEAAYRIAQYYKNEKFECLCSECYTFEVRWYEFGYHLKNINSAIALFKIHEKPNYLFSLLVHYNQQEESRKFKENSEYFSDVFKLAFACLEYLHQSKNVHIEYLNEVKLYALSKNYNNFDDDKLRKAFDDSFLSLLKKYEKDSHFTYILKLKIHESGDFKIGIYSSLNIPVRLQNLTNVEHLKSKLDHEFPWFSDLNEIVYRQLIMQIHSKTPVFKLRPLLLAGVHGIGKTSWANRLADISSVPFRTIMAAGSSDSMALKGLSRGWSSAKPSMVVQTIAQEKIGNPLFLVDEIDKSTSDFRNGRIWDVLLQMLEPSTSSKFLDECLEVECNLSHVSWIATCNEISRLPMALLNRFTIVVIKAPEQNHLQSVAKGTLTKIARELDLDERMLPELDVDDQEILSRCKSPRDINRAVRMMIESKIVSNYKTKRRH